MKQRKRLFYHFPYQYCFDSFNIFSAIWDLDSYCQEKQSEYQKNGIQGRWQVSPDDLEPPNKKLKVEEINLDGVIKMKVKNIM